MSKGSYLLLGLMVGVAPLLSSCSDDDDGSDSSAVNVSMYGLGLSFTSGVIWENNPHDLTSTVLYIYKDTYTADDGTQVTDEVEGFTASSDSKKVGNFILSLYETGLTYNDELAAAKGKGAVICFHLNSSDVSSLTEGTYEYGSLKEPGTFTAYASSEYDSQESVTPAEIDSGYVKVARDGSDYVVSFDVRTTFDGVISGTYRGQLEQCRVPQVSSAEYENVKLMGLFKKTYVEMVLYGFISLGQTESYDYGDPDFGIGYAFFSLTSGYTQYAYSRSSKELVDIALYWDEDNSQFRFESPIVMRKYLGHSDSFNFPCHTMYMKAPGSFTDEKFENITTDDFSFDIQEEEVTIPVTTEDAFEPCYVFFKTGRGVQGVMRLKQYNEKKDGELVLSDVVSYKYPVNPSLLIDIKCPAVIANPKIR